LATRGVLDLDWILTQAANTAVEDVPHACRQCSEPTGNKDYNQ